MRHPSISIPLLLVLIVSVFAAQPAQPTKEPPPYSTALRPELVGTIVPITYTSKTTGRQFTGTLTITYARDGKYLGEIGTIISGNVDISISPGCEGGIVYINDYPMAFIKKYPAGKVIIGYSRFDSPNYIVRKITSFSCRAPIGQGQTIGGKR